MLGFARLSVSAKIIILSGLISAIFLGISFGYAVINMRAIVLHARQDALLESAELKKHSLEIASENVIDTVLFLRNTPPLQGIFRAQANEGYDVEGSSTLEQWRERLATIFAAEMSSTDIYNQLRFLDVDGYEVVRVNYTDGTPEVVADDLLQHKGSRDYMKAARSLTGREVYISKAELNREGDPPQISIPYQPVIRYVVPVFHSGTGETQGFIVANVSVRALFQQHDLSLGYEAQVYITDADGFFIYHPDDARQWGGVNDIGHGYGQQDAFPRIHFDTTEPHSGMSVAGDLLTVYTPIMIHPDSTDYYWVLFEQLPEQVLTADVDVITRDALLFGCVAYFVLFILFLIVIRKILRPLAQLTRAAQQYGAGDFSASLPRQTSDEIGVLAEAFANMAKKWQALYDHLEDKVRHRTQELEKAKNDVQEKLQETERMNQVMDDRELKMVELKQEVEKLKNKK